MFDSLSGMLTCASCGHSIDIQEYAKAEGGEYEAEAAKDNVEEVTGEYRDIEEETSDNIFDDSVVKYQCENCGAELVVTEDTTATKCSFCDSPMILADRMKGKRAPTKVIPFRISREKAMEGFRKWSKKGKITPGDFASEQRVQDVVGIYVPFWLFDVTGQGEVNANCTRVSHYSSGNYNVTATKHYKVWRKFDLDYERIPADASERMDDTKMDQLEPFRYEDLEDFSAMYLLGFVAEGYNYTDDDLMERVSARVRKYIDEYVRSTMGTYTTVNITERDYRVLKKKSDYALLPVWMINYSYQNGEHVFLMNGETGKIVGKLPVSKAKVAAWLLGVGGGLFAVLRIITEIFLGGGIG